MTELSKVLTEIANKQELSVLSKTPSIISSLSTEEQQILDVKYKSKPFGKLGAAELQICAEQILIRLNVITGWIIPDNELQDVLIDEFKRKMLEAYKLMNVDEFMWAIRNCSSHINNWGKDLNLNLIDEIVQIYLSKRRGVSEIEEQKKQIEYKIPDMSNEELYEITKKTISAIEFVPDCLYDWLVESGKVCLTKERKWEFVIKAIKRQIAYLEECIAEKSTMERLWELEKYKLMLDKKQLRAEYKDAMFTLSKKIVVYEYIKDEIESEAPEEVPF